MGVLVVWRSYSSCQMSQCNALQSCLDRNDWGIGARVSAGSAGVVWSWQTCGEMGRAALGGQSGSMVVAAEAAYAEGEAGNEAVCWAQFWSVVDSDSEVGFGGGLTGHWCGFQHRLQLLMKASPASAESTVCQIRTD